MDDRHIIRLLFARAEGAIEALANRFGARLYAMARNILEDPRDAEESVSDTYLALWNAIPPQKPDPLSAYVYKVGHNTALKRLRANTALQRCSAYDLSLEELAGCIPDTALQDTLDARELGRAIDAFLDRQSQGNRVIFLRRYWFGDSVNDIARALGMKAGTVSVRLNRMRTALSDYLYKEGYL